MAKRKPNPVHETEQDPTHEVSDPEVLDPTDEEIIAHEAPSGPSDSIAPPVLPMIPATDSTSVVPVTALQQYLTEIRRYPYLSKEEELRLFQEYQLKGDRDAAVEAV